VRPGDRQLAEDAVACLEAAIAAVDPERLVREHLAAQPVPPGPLWLAGIGKAAGPMAAGARAVVGDRIVGGVLIAPEGVEVIPPPGVRLFRGGHPMPNREGAEGAEAILELARGLDASDRLLCLISGGGSALMTLPPDGVSLAEVQEATELLLKAGATIQELNAVRKHLDRLKGGRLARASAPARVEALVLSDVIGDLLDVIASGPVSPDPSTFADAVDVLEDRGLWARVPEAVRSHLGRGLEGEEEESPSAGDPCFEGVTATLVGNNRLAARAACAEAERRGYHARLLTTLMTGEAREVGCVLAALGREMRLSGEPIRPPACLVSAGETTVTVVGNGKGGRNQELVLGAALEIAGEEGIVVASIGTDGIDGPTDAAGAFADGTTVARGRAANLDARALLADNDAYRFFRAVDGLIVTGPTGTNVMDVQVVLARP
jgi:hydroxypyruvate reductase